MPCRPFAIGGVVGIACTRGARTKTCSTPGCSSKASFACDYQLANGRTCDRPMCVAHTTRPIPLQGIDYCGPHARVLVEAR